MGLNYVETSFAFIATLIRLEKRVYSPYEEPPPPMVGIVISGIGRARVKCTIL